MAFKLLNCDLLYRTALINRHKLRKQFETTFKNSFFFLFFLFSELTEDVYMGSRNGTLITVSKLTLTPSAEDDGAEVKCEAKHPAMVLAGQNYQHLRDTVKLKVFCKC